METFLSKSQYVFLMKLQKLSEQDIYHTGHSFMINRITRKQKYYNNDVDILNNMGKQYRDWKISIQ